MNARLTLALFVVAIVAFVVVLAGVEQREPTSEELAAVGVGWAGGGTPQAPRRDGDEWEIDVIRPNGSLVEVTLGKDQELLGLDEEVGPGGGPAPDELDGALRRRAAAAALAAGRPGEVLSVERDHDRTIEVGLRRPGGQSVEVSLDRGLRVLDIEHEQPEDE